MHVRSIHTHSKNMNDLLSEWIESGYLAENEPHTNNHKGELECVF